MKRNVLLLAGIFILALVVLVPSCRKEIYTDKDALAAMKEAQKYKNDLEKELLALELTNQLQLDGLRSQLSMKEYQTMDSLQKIGGKTSVSVQVYDITGNTTAMDGFSVTVNQNGAATTLTTDANGFVVFPDFMYGSSSIVVVKTGFARASGIMSIGSSSQNRQQAVLVPVFPTESATAKISGTLTAQLDLTTEAPEAVKDGIISINFTNIWNILNNPNSSLDETYGLAGIIYDGGFMQTVRTGADGKYEFKIPKTKLDITYDFSVSTIQKKQKLLFGDYPVRLDTMRLDSVPVYFGYNALASAIWDGAGIGYNYDFVSFNEFPGLNINIEAPAGGQTPTAPATINWAHNDSTVVTWSFSKFAFGDGSSEFTNITQAPVFDFDQDQSKVQVVTPTAGALNIVNGKLISLYMTNGGSYKEYGRATGKIIPTQNTGTTFKFLEELSDDDAANWSEDTLYQTAKAEATVILHGGKVKVAFNMSNDMTSHRKGKGYTAIPNVLFRLQTPITGDSALTQANLKVNLLTAGSLSIDTLVLPSSYASLTGFAVVAQPIFSTYKKDGLMQNFYSNHWVTATPATTYKVDLLNGFKIADGGLGYKTAPKVRIQNYAAKQGTTNSWTKQTIAEAATTIDVSGRIIDVSDPVMVDNFKIQENWAGTFNTQNEVTVPTDVNGLAQARARAKVDAYGTITSVLLYNESLGWEEWLTNIYGANYVSGQGYVTIPKITVNPVGKTSVTKPAVLQAVVNGSGRISNIIIVDGGKGYDVRNNPNALLNPGSLNENLETNGSSDFVYDINLGSGWHGDPNDIF